MLHIDIYIVEKKQHFLIRKAKQNYSINQMKHHHISITETQQLQPTFSIKLKISIVHLDERLSVNAQFTTYSFPRLISQ
jgi:hypothetical protein